MPSFAQILVAIGVVAGSAFAAPRYSNGTNIAERSASLTGDITYYEPGLGACGWTNSDSEYVVALSPSQYSGNCGKTITITKDGKKVGAKVVDLCPGCASGAIDVSSTTFKQLVDLSVGRTTCTWFFD
ncbi:RlpA-like double-psi beta-barrel-protein domain-containing protein-containing protein [Xylariaceae sp. AK1471]|nr:RlpA-like double-psi beta-barrel-protein domain-containing protein-containing protein [Xylariaceae sp. AK1471]